MILRARQWHVGCAVTLRVRAKFEESRLGSNSMLDVIFVVVTVVFFLISWLYVRGCDRL